ncbi:uncharacterized protein MYCFIDRAFT_200455 [Pseudocercospora fijiensis CIRAD86]|uniref:Nitrate reductase [NADPH] n=1 Tax=Pseudocercospora fijiensis (strain CIRAD86) TaxID=383855 RepID=M2YK49_PSEFD|nr:uncharacterized protein MYCFIDRAFT_200455 [Pseudocercospora fijiensis CIRAD86]EME78140.1 hypothetical protein MYCFIDRAFT_200455 [Pseudocercospora fijiensis CIRAD86]
MPPTELRTLRAFSKPISGPPTSPASPIRRFRGLRSSGTNRVGQIAPGVAGKSGPQGLMKRYHRQQQFLQWNGVRGKTTWHYGRQREPQTADSSRVVVAVLGASAVAALAAPLVSWVNNDGDTDVDVQSEREHVANASPRGADHDKLRLSEVVKHDKDSPTKWVIAASSVYDITDFIDSHPGGQVILRACGRSIDPYWELFSIHQKPQVKQILDTYHIGEIDGRDLDADGNVNWTLLGNSIDASAVDDIFKDDPDRDPELIVHTAKPCNAETPATFLGHFITPLRLFFVRHHLWVPNIDAKHHKLNIELSNGEEKEYSIDDLKQNFHEHTVTVTLQCAGNRRKHMNESGNGKTSGLAWDVGAISTAEFTGVRLRDVLLDAGYHVDQARGACCQDPEADRYIHLTAPADTYEQSIPLKTALDATSDVLLAWKMNGEEMPRDHGGPLRAIVPGSVATRSVKWVGKISIGCEESSSNWHNRDYKCFGPDVKAPSQLKPEDWDAAQSIQEMPVQSAITKIARRSDEAESPVSVSGFAYSGGGRRIVRVDVSADGGKTWKQAKFCDDDAKGSKRWTWTLWQFEWNPEQLPKDQKPEFVVRAVDESYNTQPPTFDGTWNFRGLLGNAWHRVPLPN